MSHRRRSSLTPRRTVWCARGAGAPDLFAGGGRWAASEDARQMLLKQCIVSGGFEWVDLETDVADQIRRFKNVKRIVSYHNLAEFPCVYETVWVSPFTKSAHNVDSPLLVVLKVWSSTEGLRGPCDDAAS